MVSVGPGDRAFNTATSGEAQAEFNRVAAQLENLLNLRDQQVKKAMESYEADGVAPEYAAKETRWNSKANDVRQTIHTLRMSLTKADDVAAHALKQASNAVANIV